MLHVSLLVVFMGMCVGLVLSGVWSQTHFWIVALGILCLIVGALVEALRFQHEKSVAENQTPPFGLPVRDRGRVMQTGCFSMLLAAAYFMLGLILLMFQAMAFLWG